jgi:2-polyprenyl-6-methoxyphenol hydroxylase-like FAD-dependent oxidoreductase
VRVIIAGGGIGGLAAAIALRKAGLEPLVLEQALFSTAERLAEQARGAGVPVSFSPAADSVHSFVLFDFLPEAGRALAEFAAFARQVRAG